MAPHPFPLFALQRQECRTEILGFASLLAAPKDSEHLNSLKRSTSALKIKDLLNSNSSFSALEDSASTETLLGNRPSPIDTHPFLGPKNSPEQPQPFQAPWQ